MQLIAYRQRERDAHRHAGIQRAQAHLIFDVLFLAKLCFLTPLASFILVFSLRDPLMYINMDPSRTGHYYLKKTTDDHALR